MGKAKAFGAEASPTPDTGLVKTKTYFFVAALISFLLSIYFYFTGDHERGTFVGIWVPSILSAGSLLIGGARHD
jgi:hypothetical protein